MCSCAPWPAARAPILPGRGLEAGEGADMRTGSSISRKSVPDSNLWRPEDLRLVVPLRRTLDMGDPQKPSRCPDSRISKRSRLPIPLLCALSLERARTPSPSFSVQLRRVWPRGSKRAFFSTLRPPRPLPSSSREHCLAGLPPLDESPCC